MKKAGKREEKRKPTRGQSEKSEREMRQNRQNHGQQGAEPAVFSAEMA